MKKYYFLKIGQHNNLAKAWLSGENDLHKPAAVIFFRHTRVKDLLKGNGPRQASDFCKAGLLRNRKNVVAVVVSDGLLWVIRPKSRVREIKRDKKNTWKAMEVKVLKKKKLTDVPPVLASIGTNRYLSAGTFREISYMGNIKAIRMILGSALSKKHYRRKYLTATRLFECLGSVELETLIAKLFEDKGCFVPAYRGGYMKDIDIFARNDKSKKIILDGISIEPGQTISLQVKSKLIKKRAIATDYLIALNAKKDERTLNADWLFSQVKKSPSVLAWLTKSLGWLPQPYLKHFGLA